MRRFFCSGLIFLLVFSASSAWAQKTMRLSIAAGGTGGSYYPIGGGMANIISKYVPYAEATAEVTNASVDNCLLISKGKAESDTPRSAGGLMSWAASKAVDRLTQASR